MAQEAGYANVVRESTAKITLSHMARAQQGYYFDHNQFIRDLNKLEHGIKNHDKDYRYSMSLIGRNQVQIFAVPKRSDLRSYTSSVFVIQENDSPQTLSKIFKSNQPSQDPLPAIRIIGLSLQCPAGAVDIGG